MINDRIVYMLRSVIIDERTCQMVPAAHCGIDGISTRLHHDEPNLYLTDRYMRLGRDSKASSLDWHIEPLLYSLRKLPPSDLTQWWALDAAISASPAAKRTF